MVTSIDSPSNEKIKHTVKLLSSSKFRRESGEFVLEGLRLCSDAAVTEARIKRVFFTKAAFSKSEAQLETLIEKSEAAFMISDSVCGKLALTENSQGVFCVCEIPPEKSESDISLSGKYIALENIQDPANLGAISRTAEALGINGAILESGCDVYNPKAQRAAMGSLLRLTIIKTPCLASLLSELKDSGMKVYSTTPDADAKKITLADMSGGTVAVIGNEANGVSERVGYICEKITIPMLGRAESLNASMAAAITMWEMMRR